ncbi:MAG: tRNA uridine-5-carboxymethylaminomethyl(34) synthesis GTPase MnmE [Candidatus Hydrogenedentes bacterium]|nr:tRNA uridine-5-carboxymethylaminomethyl(34) synthesis GTPase MnmE [Candidatus Hydrogenedentota bacterium]
MKARSTEDTIAAIATAQGEAGIGIVRLSGPEAVPIAASVFVSSRGCDITGPGRGRCVYHGEVRDHAGVIDEVLLHVMRAPHTYTREDVVEINCHGGPGPLGAVLEALLERGARLAGPGEFTQRAFLNGRIDLVQAEAVIDRIRARTRAALRAADAAGTGRLSAAIYAMRDSLADALARIEAAVDFPEDDLPELVDQALRRRLEGVREQMSELLDTARAGRLYREGAGVAIVGRPNVGKSSLFNALLRDARAIVTPQPGTTRDLIEEVITISGVPVRLSDTAGLRATDDEIEQMGVEIARGALRNADAVLLLVDAAAPVSEDDELLAREVSALDVPRLLVLNKIDLAPDARPPAWAGAFGACHPVSAKTAQGLKELEAALGRLLLGDVAAGPDQGLITRLHQRDSLRRAAAALDRLLANFTASPEFLSIDLRDALDALGEITGETTPEDILDRIFSSFCIGK